MDRCHDNFLNSTQEIGTPPSRPPAMFALGCFAMQMLVSSFDLASITWEPVKVATNVYTQLLVCFKFWAKLSD